MRSAFRSLVLACLLTSTGAAGAAEARIGLAAPLDGAQAILGQQMRDGARFAAGNANADLNVSDDQCSAQGGQNAALELIAAQVAVAVGFLCTEALEAALPVLTQAGIPVITSGVRSNGVTDRRQREGWLVWRVAPRADAELAAVADILVSRWREELFAIVDDGTIHGRELAESLRLAAETAGLKPLFVDTFRPQMENQIGLVGRLRRAGATHVFVGGDRDDVAIIARDAGGLDYDLTVAGGEALRAEGDVPFADGTLMVAVPEWSASASDEALARFRLAGIFPDGYVVPTHAATEIAVEATKQARERGLPIAEILGMSTFATLAGSTGFNEIGDLAQNPYRLHRYDRGRFVVTE